MSDIAGIANVPTESRIRLDIRLPKQPVRYDMDLSNNKIAPDSFPFSIWAKLTREVLAGKSAELMETPLAAGIIELRQAIADHLKSFRGMLVDPNQIVVGAGTEYLYGLIVQLWEMTESTALKSRLQEAFPDIQPVSYKLPLCRHG